MYRNQWLVLLAQRWGRRSWVTFLAIAGLLIVPRVLVTVPAGTFGPPGNVGADMAGIVFGAAEAHVGGLPWLRDYADILLIVALAAHTAHFVNQWHRLNGLPVSLHAAKLLGSSVSAPDTFAAILARHERRFSSFWLEVVAVAGAAIAVLPVTQMPTAGGLYPTFGGDASAMYRFGEWWANPTLHPAAYLVLVATLWFYLYLAFRHVAMGAVLLGMIADAIRISGRAGEPWFGYGEPVGAALTVHELRLAIFDVIVSAMLLILALVVANYWVEFPAWVLGAFVVPYFVANPVFLMWPAVELNKRLDESWTRAYEEASAELREAIGRASLALAAGPECGVGVLDEQLALRIAIAESRLAGLARTPRLVIDWHDAVKAALIYLVPVVGLLPVLLGA